MHERQQIERFWGSRWEGDQSVWRLGLIIGGFLKYFCTINDKSVYAADMCIKSYATWYLLILLDYVIETPPPVAEIETSFYVNAVWSAGRDLLYI